ncbi:hypothetical protein TWF788_000131 [Orbilia oligospora]|uniref:Uncharacterized protein n=1 Tax=Orbilia oligospora TaxID=2813651 RepID=A0A6G1MN71_ORBOL|nr:hypothetical protein TWF788_000131 [Orbilia oligospora]KAF3231935.1 hypothetical protein TWF191_003911 [Orbilia oligospora]KAF3263447.1 hypothetical protein TWF192_005728 [Orbilia oligospora]
MATLPGFSSLDGIQTTQSIPHVPKPRLGRQNNMTIAHVSAAFSDEYWLQERGARNGISLMRNILAVIQEILEIVLGEYEDQFSKKFPTYLRQSVSLKKAIQNRFFELLEIHQFENEGDRPLIREMMKATESSDIIEQSEGRHWLFEYCMRRITENRTARERNGTRKIHRGVAYWEDNR